MSAVEQRQFVDTVLGQPVDEAVVAMADKLCGQISEQGVVGILTYGSCLRGVGLTDSLIDYYVIVRTPRDVSNHWLSQRACQVMPPNVYFAQFEIKGVQLRAKYAVVDIETFSRWMGRRTHNPYFWARFSQPSALVWSGSRDDRAMIIEAVKAGVATMMGHCLVFCPPGKDPQDEWRAMWEATLVETYRTELRAEGPSRAAQIIENNAPYYQTASRLFAEVEPIATRWPLERARGKMFSVLRLLKAAFTFAGGAEYLAWKISRHSGVEVKLTPWQKRHPILAALYLLPGLLRKGAVR